MVNISFSCPICEKQLRVQSDLAGTFINCPFCGNGIVVPSKSNLTQISSSHEKRKKENSFLFFDVMLILFALVCVFGFFRLFWVTNWWERCVWLLLLFIAGIMGERSLNKNNSNPAGILLPMLLVIIPLCLSISCRSCIDLSKTDNSQKAKTNAEQNKRILQYEIEYELKKLLKDPKSAEFSPGMVINEIEHMGQYCYKAIGWVRAKNSFGGYEKVNYWAILKKGSLEIIETNL